MAAMRRAPERALARIVCVPGTEANARCLCNAGNSRPDALRVARAAGVTARGTGTDPMSDQPENFVLVYLRRLDEKMDRMLDGLQDLGRRVTSLEMQIASLHGDVGLLHGDFAGQSLRIDRIEQRLDRIERRLDLVQVGP
jgi:hypothetical protein